MTQAPILGETARCAPGHPGLPAGLLLAGAYPHPVTEPIRVIETHISWVLLTGVYAYKVKKAVALPFLDYSTLAARRHCCEEEIRLNRRMASELYLGTVAIHGPAGSARVVPMEAGQGPPADTIEYAVQMRQFDAGQELDVLLSCNALEVETLRGLGETVGRFHAAADPIPVEAGCATARQIAAVFADNLAELADLTVDRTGWTDTISRLTHWSRHAVIDLATRLERRRVDGWTRDCHGDLHCGNIARWNGHLTPFDCIDFDPRLRRIDIINDLAFLTMDLAVHDQPNLRHALLDAWCATTGDYLGLELLRFYETGRAIVRSKVCALRAAQQAGATDSSAPSLTQQAQRYAHWALRRCQQLGPRPLLLIMCGMSGSGKTFLARRLAAQLHCLHIRSDVERKRLAGLAALASSDSPPDGGIYTLSFNTQTYQRLAECAHAALHAGENVVVDAACLRRTERDLLMSIGLDNDAQVQLIHCTAPQRVLRERIATRVAAGNDASEATVELVDRQSNYWESLTPSEAAHVISVDTTAADIVLPVLARINAGGASR
jgi:aminoglycoside phosphotransferase family enzyme/predicted kinase